MTALYFSNKNCFRNIKKDLPALFLIAMKKKGAPEGAPCLTNYRTKTTIAAVMYLKYGKTTCTD